MTPAPQDGPARDVPRADVSGQNGPVLILGGGGFLGTNMTARLVAAGRRVINVSRSHLHREPGGLARYLAPAPDRLADLVAQSSCVLHMAHGSSPATSLLAMERNLAASMELTFALMRACAEHGVRLVYLSSGGAIYGPDAPVPTPETAPTLPISPYGVEKLTAERYLHVGALHLGLDYRVLRISNPYGPWQLGLHGQGVIGTWMRRILSGQPVEIWGDGSLARDYVYVDDVLRAMERAMEHRGAARIFNIGSGTATRLDALLGHLRPLCDDRLQVIFRDSRPAHVPVSRLDVSLAQHNLGWQAEITLDSGLAATWQWMRAYNGDT